MAAKPRARRRPDRATRAPAASADDRHTAGGAAAPVTQEPPRSDAAPGDYEWEIERLDAAVADQTGRR